MAEVFHDLPELLAGGFPRLLLERHRTVTLDAAGILPRIAAASASPLAAVLAVAGVLRDLEPLLGDWDDALAAAVRDLRDVERSMSPFGSAEQIGRSPDRIRRVDVFHRELQSPVILLEEALDAGFF
ncbi:MAG: hypothetical protein WBC44_00975 [Planctomycetaceae bacterium]